MSLECGSRTLTAHCSGVHCLLCQWDITSWLTAVCHVAVLIASLPDWEVKNNHFAISITERVSPLHLNFSSPGRGSQSDGSLRSRNKALAKPLMSESFTDCCCKHLGWLPCTLGSSAEGGKEEKHFFLFLLWSCCLQNVRLLASVLTLATSQPQCLHSCWQRESGLTSFQNIFFFSPPHDFLCLPRRKRFVGNLWRYNSVTFHLRSEHTSHFLHLKLL